MEKKTIILKGKGESHEKSKILLLDFNPVGDLGDMLYRILKSSLSRNIQIQKESVGVCGSDFCNNGLSSIVSDFNPDVIFFVLSPSPLGYAISLFESMKRELSTLPIIVVIESGEPDKIFEMLKPGVTDFITPPLKAIDILPLLLIQPNQCPAVKSVNLEIPETKKGEKMGNGSFSTEEGEDVFCSQITIKIIREYSDDMISGDVLRI